MTTILTVWLLAAGQWVGADITIDGGQIDCARTAAAIAADNGAQLVAFSCVLEIAA